MDFLLVAGQTEKVPDITGWKVGWGRHSQSLHQRRKKELVWNLVLARKCGLFSPFNRWSKWGMAQAAVWLVWYPNRSATIDWSFWRRSLYWEAEASFWSWCSFGSADVKFCLSRQDSRYAACWFRCSSVISSTLRSSASESIRGYANEHRPRVTGSGLTLSVWQFLLSLSSSLMVSSSSLFLKYTGTQESGLKGGEFILESSFEVGSEVRLMCWLLCGSCNTREEEMVVRWQERGLVVCWCEVLCGEAIAALYHLLKYCGMSYTTVYILWYITYHYR